MYAEVHQRRENRCFSGIGEKPGGKEDALSVLQEFFVRVLEMQPEEVLKIEFQRVHRVGKTNIDGKPRAITVRFLHYQDREFIFSKMSLPYRRTSLLCQESNDSRVADERFSVWHLSGLAKEDC